MTAKQTTRRLADSSSPPGITPIIAFACLLALISVSFATALTVQLSTLRWEVEQAMLDCPCCRPEDVLP